MLKANINKNEIVIETDETVCDVLGDIEALLVIVVSDMAKQLKNVEKEEILKDIVDNVKAIWARQKKMF